MNKRRSSNDTSCQPLKVFRANNNKQQVNVGRNSPDDDSADKEHVLSQILIKLKQVIDQNDNNKLSKENIWENDAINWFQMFVECQIQLDYRFMSQCIPAITKVYTLRVDSLYDDVVRLCSYLGKVSERKKKQIEANVDDLNPEEPRQVPTRRKIKRKGTVTANPESLNAKLLANISTDPFFGKLNSCVGEMTRSNLMLMNLLPSQYNGNLGWSLAFWNLSDGVELSENSRRFSDLVSVSFSFNVDDAMVRVSNADYRITDDSYENYRFTTFINLLSSDDESDFEKSVNRSIVKNLHQNVGGSAGAGMIDRKSFQTSCMTQESGYETMRETISQFSLVGSVVDSLHDAFCSSFNDDPIEPIKSKKENLSERQEYVEDMEPENTDQFEYSYRAADLIINYYAGPSHWKFLRQKVLDVVDRRKKTKFKKLNFTVTIDDLRQFDEKSSSLTRSLIHKPFACLVPKKKKLIMPFDYSISPQLFLGFTNSSLGLHDPIVDIAYEPAFDAFSYDSDNDNENDSNIPSNSFYSNVNFSLPHSFGMRQRNVSMFAKRPCNFDIRMIKDASLTIVQQQTHLGDKEIKFSTVYTKVDKMFENIQESSSCALTLLSILQAASEKKIFLKQGDFIDDFNISLYHESF